MDCGRLLVNSILSRFITRPRLLHTCVTAQRVCRLQINAAEACCKRRLPTIQCSSTVLPVRDVTTSSMAVDVAASHSDFTAVAERVNTQLMSQDTGRLFAVVHIGGKQRKVTREDIIIVDKHLAADVGQRIRLNKVLLVGGCDFTVIGRPVLSATVARVEATIIEKTLSHTNICFWYYKRKNHRVFRLHRAQYTFLRISSIDLAPVEDS